MDTLTANQPQPIIVKSQASHQGYQADTNSDKSQWKMTNQSDSLEFDNLFREYYRSLRAYAFRYVNDLYVAEDIVQDVFLKLWEKRNTLNQINSIRSYLFTSVFNGVQNFIKHKKVEDHYQTSQSDIFKEIELYYTKYICSSAESLIARELEGEISEAIDNLPEQCKNVFILSRLRGLKNHEIANYLGVTVKAVEKQMTSALKILRIRLKEYIVLLLFCMVRITSFFN